MSVYRAYANLAKGMHWIYPSIGGAIMAFGLGSIGDIAITVVIDAYKEVRVWLCLKTLRYFNIFR